MLLYNDALQCHGRSGHSISQLHHGRHCSGFAGGSSAAMPVRQFLSTISPVIAREPAVFVEAMANTCNVEEASGAMGSGRPIVLLKPKVATLYTQT